MKKKNKPKKISKMPKDLEKYYSEILLGIRKGFLLENGKIIHKVKIMKEII